MKALYFYIHSSFGRKNTVFNHIHTLFHPSLMTSFAFLTEMKKFPARKDSFYMAKSRHLFEMVQTDPTVPKNKGLL